MATTYYHHFFSRGCELAGCEAPSSRCDLYLVPGERRAVSACSALHARCAAAGAVLAELPDIYEPTAFSHADGTPRVTREEDGR